MAGREALATEWPGLPASHGLAREGLAGDAPAVEPSIPTVPVEVQIDRHAGVKLQIQSDTLS